MSSKENDPIQIAKSATINELSNSDQQGRTS